MKFWADPGMFSGMPAKLYLQMLVWYAKLASITQLNYQKAAVSHQVTPLPAKKQSNVDGVQ